MGEDERRRDDGGFVTRGELRAVEARWKDQYAGVRDALKFYDQMCELGLREYLPSLLASERARAVVKVLREGRYQWAVRLGVWLLPPSLAVGFIGGGLAILRTFGWIR